MGELLHGRLTPLETLFNETAILPSLTPSLIEPEPVTVVFCPSVNDVGVSPEIFAFVDASPQSFHVRPRTPPSTKVSAPALPNASAATNLFIAAATGFCKAEGYDAEALRAYLETKSTQIKILLHTNTCIYEDMYVQISPTKVG